MTKFERIENVAGRALVVLLAAVLFLTGTLVMPEPVMADSTNVDYNIYYDGSDTGYVGHYVKGNVYLPITMVGNYCKNAGVTVDTAGKKLVIDISKENIMMADDTTTNFIKANAGTIYVPLKTIGGAQFFSLNVMESFFKLSYSVTGTKIKLHAYSASAKIATVTANGTEAVPSAAADTTEKLTFSMGDRLYIDGSTNHYYTFASEDGVKYYVMKNAVKVENIDLSKVDFYGAKKAKTTAASTQGKINLVWDYVSGESGVTAEAPKKYAGIDVLAPTWFRLKVNDGGNIENVGDRGYVDLAHDRGYKVWACITNNMSVSGSTKFTTKMFGDQNIQKRAIAQYVLYACMYDVDGINIDFEDVVDADRDGLTAFVKQMRNYTDRQGLTLSIDTLVPAAWNVEYDRASLSNYVDFLAIMTYDEHYSGSKTPGSIASLPWVEKAVKATLEEGVPKEKLLMGVPLYTRVWVTDGAGKIVSNTSYKMPSLQNALQVNNVTTTYLSTEKQNYGEWTTDKGHAQVWIEDSTSITNRMYLIKTYDLAGSACWQYSQGSEDIWPVFDKYLH